MKNTSSTPSSYKPSWLLISFRSCLSTELKSQLWTRKEAQSNQNSLIKISNQITLLPIILAERLGALLRACLLQGSPGSEELGYKASKLTDDWKCKLEGEESAQSKMWQRMVCLRGRNGSTATAGPIWTLWGGQSPYWQVISPPKSLSWHLMPYFGRTAIPPLCPLNAPSTPCSQP